MIITEILPNNNCKFEYSIGDIVMLTYNDCDIFKQTLKIKPKTLCVVINPYRTRDIIKIQTLDPFPERIIINKKYIVPAGITHQEMPLKIKEYKEVEAVKLIMNRTEEIKKFDIHWNR